MNKNKSMRLLTSLFGGSVISLAVSSVAFAGGTLDYKITLSEDGDVYEVWMRPSVTPKPDISLTGQVTIKVPSEVEFTAVDIVSSVEGADWIEASRVNSPEEAAEHDYISFSYIGLQGNSAHNYGWKADEEKLVFSFKSEGGCVDGVSIIAGDDPFNIKDNSANTNPGNQFTNLGLGSVGGNHFGDIYGEAIACNT